MRVTGLHRWVRATAVGCSLLFATTGTLAAQATGTIHGTIRNTQGAPIAGAQIHIEGRGVGTISGADGAYLLQNLQAGSHTVIVQFLGFATERRAGVTIAAGQRLSLDFTLRPQALALDGIIVTGVTEATNQAMVPFSVGRISQDAMAAPPASAITAIQGRLTGVNIVAGSAPGTGSSILFRTPTSINRENAPLIVVDDVILSSSSVDLSTLDIESVEIIKGAAAASLYGSRAAAGVLNIRTLRGSSLPAERMLLRVRSEFGTSDIANPIQWARYHNFRMDESGNFLDASGNSVKRTLAAVNRFGFQDQRYPGKTYDHIGSLFNPGSYATHSAVIGFHGPNTSWLATLGRREEAGVVRESNGYQRNDFRLNLDHNLSNDLKLSLSAFHMRSQRDELPSNFFFDFIHQAPDVDLLQPDPDGTKYIFQPDEQGIRVNPLYQIMTYEEISSRFRTMASANVRYRPLDWLALDANASYDRSDRQSRSFRAKGAKTPNNPDGGPGTASRSTASTDGVNASIGMTLSRNFGALQTRTSVRGLIEREDNSSFSASGQDLSVGGIGELPAIKVPAISSSASAIRSTGYFLNTDLTYGDRYILNALIRRDGSSLFGRLERWHNYYRISGAYRMAQEDWWPTDRISEFKLRYSRGTAGGRPSFSDRFETFSLQAGGGLSLSSLGNAFLKPEKTTEQEIGIDAILFDRFSLQLNYATQVTEDQLIAVPLPDIYGFSSQWQNAGTIEGHTYEGSLETRIITTPNLRWSVTLLADRSRNKVTAYDRPCHASGFSYRCAGEVLGIIYGQKFVTTHDELPGQHANSRDAFQVNDDGLLVPVGAGNSWKDGVAKELWGTNVVIDGVSYPWGRPVLLKNPDGTAAVVRIGDSNPDLKWGFSQQLQWRSITLGALIDGQLGGQVYNNTKQRMYQYARHHDADQLGKPEELKKPAAYYTGGSGGLYNGNNTVSWFIEKAAYTKLRELSVRYRLNAPQLSYLSRLGIDNATLALTGRNLFIWTGYSGYDPEVGSAINRIDDFDYPTYRTLTASLEIQF